MFVHNDSIYADAGKILISKDVIGYRLSVNTENVEERDIDLSSLHLRGRLIEGDIRILNHPTFTFDQWKTHIVKWRYSNDDQIAIMLNKDRSDEDLVYYNKMQEWREWASALAHALVDINN